MSPRTGTPTALRQAAPRTIDVLVVANDPRVRTSLRHLLASEPDMHPIAERDERQPDVVLVDLAPGAPAEFLRMTSTSTAAVVVLGFDETDRAKAASYGVDTFVPKTAPPETVAATIRRAAAARSNGNHGFGSAGSCSAARIAVVTGALFLGPWAFWLSRIAEDRGLIGWHLPQGAALWSITPVLLAALAWTSGRTGLRDLWQRIVHWRIPRWSWAAALLAPLGIGLVTAGVVRAAGGSVPVGEMLSLPAALVYLCYGTGLFLLTEEAGWRGVLLPRLQRRLGPTPAAVAVGALWALWHLPLLAVPDAGDHGLPLLPFVVLIVSTSVLMTALVNAATGSVLIAALFHASFDACYSYLGVVGDQHAMLWVASVVTTVAAVALVTVTRRRLFLPAESPR